MRLTVGPLPAAVYWRRRAVVLAGLALIVLIVSYACGGSDTSTAGTGEGVSGQPATTSTPRSSPASTLLRPTSPTPQPTTPTPTAFTLSVGSDVPCSDAEMEVRASAAVDQVRHDTPVDVTITIKNISNRTCSRDIGADMQELRLINGKATIWSSDDCGANKGHNVSSFSPGKQVSYTLRWTGKRSRTGTGAVSCTLGAPDPGTYQLVARLDQMLSVPFDLHIEA